MEKGVTPASDQNIAAADALWEARQAIATGVWPEEYLEELMGPVYEWAKSSSMRFHHIGYTYPDRDAFEAATQAAPGALIASDLVTPHITHHRRYLRVPRDDGPDTFIEYHLAGEEGNGVCGVHLDFVAEGADGMLAHMRDKVNARSLDAEVVTQDFGGGFAPVGKVALQPSVNPGRLEVGVMSRTHWSDPVDW